MTEGPSRAVVLPLLKSRRFAPLFVTQFLGAFNDNLLKSGLAIFVTYRLAHEGGTDAATLVMLAGGIFIAPFFLFSGASGTLADRVDKAKIARWVKIAEVFIMATGAAGFALSSVPLLLVALFGLGTHSTVFGPIKYALLPEHLVEHELVAGNALIEAGTFLAILIGTILGGSLMQSDNGALIVGVLGVIVALAGWISARQIPLAPPRSATVARPRLLHDSIDVVKHVASRDELFLPVLALSWFWLIGGTLVSGLPVFAKDVLYTDEQVVTLMLALFAIGIAAGSLLAERLLRGEVSARFVPMSGLLMAAFAFDLFLSSAGREPAAGMTGVEVHRPAGKLARPRGSRCAGRRRRRLHGAALRAPAARQRARASRPRDRGEQHRQLAVHDSVGGVRSVGAR